jgi:hypothetical protein
MLSLRSGVHATQTTSARSLRSALGANRTSVRELLQTSMIHRHYLSTGGRDGPLGYPTSEVRSSGITAEREYRGGDIQVLDSGATVGFVTREASVRLLGFRCVKEATSDQATPTDEPYFVITVDVGDGRPETRKFGPFQNVETGTLVTVGEIIVSELTPNPLSIRVHAYENDHGNPEETAKAIQEKAVELSKAVAAAAGSTGADVADGPGAGPGAIAAGLGGVLAGPIGALGAALIVEGLDLGDDHIGERAVVEFARPEKIGTPPKQGDVQPGMEFNAKVDIDGGDDGVYEVFFDVVVLEDIQKTLPAPVG